MAKPGKRVGVHSDWRIAFVRRVVAARKIVFPDEAYPTLGAAQRKMAEALKERTGREISYDTYRKYEIEEQSKGGALLRQDLIIPFCEITRTNPTALLEGPPSPVRPQTPGSEKETRRPFTKKRPEPTRPTRETAA